jgi:hypothetical protein
MTTLQNVVDYLQANGKDPFENCSTPEPIDIELVKDYIMLRCGLLTPVYSEPELFKIQTRMWFSKMQWEFDHLVKILLTEYDPIDNVTEWTNTTEMHSGTDSRVLGGSETLSGSDTLTHGETHSLTGSDSLVHGQTHTLSGTDTNTDTTGTEHKVSAYNSGGYQADSQDTNSGSITTTYGKTDTASGTDSTEYGRTDTASGDDVTEYGKVTTLDKTDDLTHGERIETRVHRHGNIGIVSPDDMIMKELDMLERFNVYDWIARKFERDNMIQVY